MNISIYDFDDRYAIFWADERSRLPPDHPDHSREARDLISGRALARMERQVDAMIAAMSREFGAEGPDHG